MFTADFPAVTKWQHASKKKKSNSYRYKCIYIKHYRVSVLNIVTGHFITGGSDPFSHFT